MRCAPAALVLPIFLALWLRLQNLDAYTGSFDEGIRSQQLLLMSAGYRPFRDIFSSQGPLLLDLLFPFYLGFGQTLEAARAGVVACSIVGLVGVWWIGRLAAGPLAGLAAATFLAVSPGYLEGSRLALAEVPTIAPALLAIGAILAYRERGRWRWLALSAVCCALALLIKPMVAHVLTPLGLLLILPRHSVPGGTSDRVPGGTISLRRRLADVVGFGGIVLMVSGITVVTLGPADVWDNLGAYRTGAGHAVGSDVAQNARLTANLLARERAWLFVLALVGVGLGLARRPAASLALAGWALSILAMFLLYGDLADKHIVYMVPPVAILAGSGAALSLAEAVGRRNVWSVWTASEGRARRWLAAPGLAALALYLVADAVPLYRSDRFIVHEAEIVAERRRDRQTELEIVDIIRSHTSVDDWVLSDNPGAAFEAGRKVIPSLADTSGTRVDAGSLTAPKVIDAVSRYRPAVVVTWPRRLGRLDDFTRWLPTAGYRLERAYEAGWRVYVTSR